MKYCARFVGKVANVLCLNCRTVNLKIELSKSLLSREKIRVLNLKVNPDPQVI